MNVGDSFSPFRLFTGIYIPDALVPYKNISAAEKICLARLYRYCGESDTCFPAQETLAIELGVEVRSVGSYLRSLEQDGFIRIEQRGLGRCNQYVMLFHNIFDGRQTNSSGQDRKNLAGQDKQTSSGLDMQGSSGPTYRTEEGQNKRESKEEIQKLTSATFLSFSINPEDPIETFVHNAYRKSRGVRIKLNRGQDKPMVERLRQSEDRNGQEYFRQCLLGYLGREDSWMVEHKWELNLFLKNPDAYHENFLALVAQDDAQRAADSVPVAETTSGATEAPQPVPERNWLEEWNQLVPEQPTENNSFKNLLLTVQATDPEFRENFEKICDSAKQAISIDKVKSSYLTLYWLCTIKRGETRPNWWKLIFGDLRCLTAGAKSKVGGPWKPGMPIETEEETKQYRAWQGRRLAKDKHGDPDRAAKEGEIDD